MTADSTFVSRMITNRSRLRGGRDSAIVRARRPEELAESLGWPALEGLEDRWADTWASEGTYAFDRSAERSEVFSAGARRIVTARAHEQTRAIARESRLMRIHAGVDDVVASGTCSASAGATSSTS